MVSPKVKTVLMCFPWALRKDSKEGATLAHFAVPVSVGLRLLHHRRLLLRREERDAWNAHAQHNLYLTMAEVRDLCACVLPGAKIKKHLMWRYSIVWEKPSR